MILIDFTRFFLNRTANQQQNPSSKTAIVRLYKLVYRNILRAREPSDFWSVIVRFSNDSILRKIKPLIFQSMKIGRGFAGLKINRGKEFYGRYV
jgi:hypothetical protein